MLEMTACGCPKPAMRSVEFARTWGVRLHVRSAFTWEPGTWVQEEDPSMEQAIVSAVVHDTSEAKVTVSGVPDQPGIAARLFRLLADREVNVDMIVQNTSDHGVTDISFTVPHDDLADRARRSPARSPREIGATGVTSDADIARVSLVGAGMKSNPGVAATHLRDARRASGINIEMISTSAIRISCIVREAQVEQAVQALHDAFDARPLPRSVRDTARCGATEPGGRRTAAVASVPCASASSAPPARSVASCSGSSTSGTSPRRAAPASPPLAPPGARSPVAGRRAHRGGRRHRVATTASTSRSSPPAPPPPGRWRHGWPPPAPR